MDSDELAEILDAKTLNFMRELGKIPGLHQQALPEASILVSPQESAHYLSVADKLMSIGQAQKAEIILLGLLNSCPSSEPAILKLAELYEQEGSYSKTLELAGSTIASSRGSNNQEAHYQYAFSLFKLGRTDEALEAILPWYVNAHPPRVARLCGLILKSLGQQTDAIEVFEKAIAVSPEDIHSIRALSEIYTEIGMFQKSLNLLQAIPDHLREDGDRLCEALMLRFMGELELAMQKNSDIINEAPDFPNALWTQCFNFSTAGSKYSDDLVSLAKKFWKIKKQECLEGPALELRIPHKHDKRIKIAFLTSDLGEHVVSRFMAPLLRHYDKSRYHITLLSTQRRFEEKASELVSLVDRAVSLQELNWPETCELLESVKPDAIIEMNGFTRHSGIGLLTRRCAPVQCHYIGYHATTGLDTMDYFIGDSITTPSDFQWQFTEELVQIPNLWMAYDSTIEFPVAHSTTKRNCPVFGSFSQTAKINRITLEYWAEAMNKVPNAILVIKDRGTHCDSTRKRLEATLSLLGVNPDRVYMFGAVATQLDHLDAYNAIDIALDTTPWSGATTAFEALGMGVPLVAICGNTTSGRMSTSVVSAAGMKECVANSKEQFATIVDRLAKDYQQIRADKAEMQQQVRAGILFDENRICRDFFTTIDKLVSRYSQSKKPEQDHPA